MSFSSLAVQKIVFWINHSKANSSKWEPFFNRVKKSVRRIEWKGLDVFSYCDTSFALLTNLWQFVYNISYKCKVPSSLFFCYMQRKLDPIIGCYWTNRSAPWVCAKPKENHFLRENAVKIRTVICNTKCSLS